MEPNRFQLECQVGTTHSQKTNIRPVSVRNRPDMRLFSSFVVPSSCDETDQGKDCERHGPDRLEHGSDESLVIPWCFTAVESSFDGEQKNESERAVGDDGERHNDDLPGQLEDVCHSSIPSSRPVSGSSGMNGIVT